MFDAQTYMTQFTAAMQQAFGERLIYVGLQGSYLREEATEESDIDPMTVIDSLTPADLDLYRDVIQTLPQPEKSCGFLCGREELLNWNSLELCHLLYSTKDIFGSLRELLPSFTREDAARFISLGLGNLYHELCHRYVHGSREKNEAKLPGTYRSVFFLLQDLHFLRTGHFPAAKTELLPLLHGDDRAVLEAAMVLKQGGEYDFDSAFSLIFRWCGETMKTLKEMDL